MSYSDFKSLQRLQRDLNIAHQKTTLFAQIQPVAPSQKLQDDLAEAQYYSLITPTLKEIRRSYPDQIAVFSGVNLDLPSENLNGFCDFILSDEPNTVEFPALIFCLVEAKNRTIEEGFARLSKKWEISG